jgi:hypothetical protein
MQHLSIIPLGVAVLALFSAETDLSQDRRVAAKRREKGKQNGKERVEEVCEGPAF